MAKFIQRKMCNENVRRVFGTPIPEPVCVDGVGPETCWL